MTNQGWTMISGAAELRKILPGVVLVILAGVNALTQEPGVAANGKFPAVTVPGSEIRSLKSVNTGRAYAIYLRLPDHYRAGGGKKYPVLYVLDGQWDFKLLDSVYGGLLYDKFVPDMIIVGITYSGPSPNYDVLRAMDYTPSKNSQVPGSGDAPKFLAFLKNELIPFVEGNFQADGSKRILMGSSYGGLFTLYALFEDPGLFGAYVAASPAVPYDGDFAFKQEAKYAKGKQDLSAKLFVSVGSIEPLAGPVQDYIKQLSARGYKGLKLETRTIEGERHAGNKPEAFNRGLRFVFEAGL